MLIRMRSTAAGPAFIYAAGREYEVPPEIGAALVLCGAAVDLAPATPAAECAAMQSAPETATIPRAFKRRR